MKKAQQLHETQSKPAATGAGLTRRERQRRRCLRSLLLVVATILCINTTITLLLISWRTPVTVSFDMKKRWISLLNRLVPGHWMSLRLRR